VPPLDYAAGIAYLAMTEVPEHFIPFIPTHVPGSVREIQLQHARGRAPARRHPRPPGLPAGVLDRGASLTFGWVR
jgi:hypothetical protein